MKTVRKKSADAAVNAMIIKANHDQTELTWNRAEAMQPQCGFGRMTICCSDCKEGPCRTNPFATIEQPRTICGRSQGELVSDYFLEQALDGAAALVGVANSFEADVDQAMMQMVCTTKDTMVSFVDYSSRLVQIGDISVRALKAIQEVNDRIYGKTQPEIATVNLGALKADAINVVLHGPIAPKIVNQIAELSADNSIPVHIATLCGNEANSGINIAMLTNYESQEAPLLTGVVDLLVVGTQCVMPAVVSLAKTLDIPVASVSALGDIQKVKEAIQAATIAFESRTRKTSSIPECSEQAYIGYTAGNSNRLLEMIAAGYAQGAVQGLVYFGGCGTIAKTQDAQFVKLATRLLSNGYMIVTAGCAGVALAKAGMCRPEYAASAGLKSILPSDVPPVLFIGSCYNAGEFLAMAQAVRQSGMPIFAVMPEINHNKVLATAIGFATEGISVYVDRGEAVAIPENVLKGKILPLSDFEQLPQVLSEVAAAK